VADLPNKGLGSASLEKMLGPVDFEGRKRKVCWERLILSGQQVVEGFFSDFDCKWEKTKQKKICFASFFFCC
jgi:hypothetical protein